MGLEDVEQIREWLREMENNPAILAEADQKHAVLEDLKRNGTWWAALALLSTERENPVAYAIATQQLKRYLHSQDHDDLVILTFYLLCNTLAIVSAHVKYGDTIGMIEELVGHETVQRFNEFIATDGQSCPDCGHPDAFSDDHDMSHGQDDGDGFGHDDLRHMNWGDDEPKQS